MIDAGRRAAPIVRLPQAVADAIAAGEVVERPASVVKELCENSVDAGAKSVDVVIDGAGTTRIRVVDDGSGINAADLALAVARHATSKIRSAQDLEAVATLGFRGEALASIAAVADLTIASRTAAEPAGRRLRVRHGTVVEEGAWGGPLGTSIEVLDLFAATPARLRFLRAERSESAAAVAVTAELALAHPSLRVGCTVDGRVRLRAPGTGLDGALAAVFGAEARELLPVDAPGEITVRGAISEPRRHRATRSGLAVIVNGRRVHNRALFAAASEAYRGLVPANRHPFGVLDIGVDPTEVDVNVHPAKREVRFRDERRVFAAVQRACWLAVQGATVYHISGTESATPWPHGAAATTALNDAPAHLGEPAGAVAELGDAPAHTPAPPPSSAETLADLRPLRALGQQAGRWLLASSPRGVVVVDPHAAHEKVLYAELLASWSAGSAPRQLLLLPALIECDARRLDLMATHGELLGSFGFAIEPFGPATVRCTAVPAAAVAADPARLVGEVLDSLGAEGPVGERRHRAAALVACHAAVRFGDELGATEQQRLLDRLIDTPGGVTCPHGRPTLAVFDDTMLRRVFRRPAAG